MWSLLNSHDIVHQFKQLRLTAIWCSQIAKCIFNKLSSGSRFTGRETVALYHRMNLRAAVPWKEYVHPGLSVLVFCKTASVAAPLVDLNAHHMDALGDIKKQCVGFPHVRQPECVRKGSEMAANTVLNLSPLFQKESRTCCTDIYACVWACVITCPCVYGWLSPHERLRFQDRGKL